MTEFEKRLDTLIKVLSDPNITINPNGFAKIKENLLLSAKEGLWHDAHGDVLPEYEREVIILCDNGKVCYGHRPNKKGYLGKSLVTGNAETFYPHTYGKGGWNIPDVKWWLDCFIPDLNE
jgi:hypothetical protein